MAMSLSIPYVIVEYLDELAGGGKLIRHPVRRGWRVKSDHSLLAGHARFDAAVRYEKMVRPQGLQWQAWSDDHGTGRGRAWRIFEKAAGNAGAGRSISRRSPYMRARLRRFPLRRLRLAQSLSEARCFHEKMLARSSVKNLAAAAGLIAGSCHESQAYRRRSHIHRIIEQENHFLPALDMLPGLTPEVLAANKPWMRDAGAIDADDVLILCFQSYVVKTPHHTFLGPTAARQRQATAVRPKWNMKSDNYLICAGWRRPALPSATSIS